MERELGPRSYLVDSRSCPSGGRCLAGSRAQIPMFAPADQAAAVDSAYGKSKFKTETERLTYLGEETVSSDYRCR